MTVRDATVGPLSGTFLRRIGAPLACDPPVRTLVENHHAHDNGGGPFTDTAVRRLAKRLAPASIAAQGPRSPLDRRIDSVFTAFSRTYTPGCAVGVTVPISSCRAPTTVA